MTDKKPAKRPAKKTPAKKDGQPGPKTMKVIEGTKGPELKSVPRAKSKELQVIEQIAEVHNLDPKDINSEVYEDRPLIAEQELAIKVLSLCEAGQFELAAKEIEIAVRLAHQVEAAQ